MSDLLLYLLLAIFGGVISFAKDWKPSSEQNFKTANFLTAIAFLLLIIGSWKACGVGKMALNEKALSDSIAKVKDSVADVYKDSLISSQNQLLNLEKRELDTADKIISLSSSLIATQQKLFNYQTGGNSIPLLISIVRYYEMDHYARWNGPQVEEFIDKWIIQFKVKNTDLYPISNIRSNRVISGSNIEKDSAFFTTNILGPKEEKELQSTYILGEQNPSGSWNFNIHVQWMLKSYDCSVYVVNEESKDLQDMPSMIYVATTKYSYNGITYNNPEDLRKAIEASYRN